MWVIGVGSIASRLANTPSGSVQGHGDRTSTHPTSPTATNGMMERFNGRIRELVRQTRFGSAAELESTLRNYLKIYNNNTAQRALENQTDPGTQKVAG